MVYNKDIFWMKKTIKLIKFSKKENEIPITSIIVHNNIYIEGWNKTKYIYDPTNHAEIIVIKKLYRKIKYRNIIKNNTTIYVTLEPCIMCIGAILNAKINKLVYLINSYNTYININSLKNKIKIINISLFDKNIKNKYKKEIKNFFIKKRNK